MLYNNTPVTCWIGKDEFPLYGWQQLDLTLAAFFGFGVVNNGFGLLSIYLTIVLAVMLYNWSLPCFAKHLYIKWAPAWPKFCQRNHFNFEMSEKEKNCHMLTITFFIKVFSFMYKFDDQNTFDLISQLSKHHSLKYSCSAIFVAWPDFILFTVDCRDNSC